MGKCDSQPTRGTVRCNRPRAETPLRPFVWTKGFWTMAKDETKPEADAKKRKKLPSMAVRKTCFIELLRRSANVSRAAREAGIASSTVYRQRAGSKTFAQDWDNAVAEALDALEEAVMGRVRDGVARPVFYAGAQVGTVHQFSDQLAMFVLKSKRPEVYNRLPQAVAEADEMTEVEAEKEFDRRMARLKAN